MFTIVLTGINVYMYLFVVASWTVSFLLTMRGSRGVSKVCICTLRSRVAFLEYLGWSKPCSRFDKASVRNQIRQKNPLAPRLVYMMTENWNAGEANCTTKMFSCTCNVCIFIAELSRAAENHRYEKLVIYASKKFWLWQNSSVRMPVQTLYHVSRSMWNGTVISLESKAYTVCLTWYWSSMLCSIDSCLTSVTWLYHGLKYTTHWGDVFFKAIFWPVFCFSIDHSSGFFKVKSGGIQFASAYGKSLIARERHFLKDPSRALFLALAKSIYY